jgi:hypothetical protein
VEAKISYDWANGTGILRAIQDAASVISGRTLQYSILPCSNHHANSIVHGETWVPGCVSSGKGRIVRENTTRNQWLSLHDPPVPSPDCTHEFFEREEVRLPNFGETSATHAPYERFKPGPHGW